MKILRWTLLLLAVASVCQGQWAFARGGGGGSGGGGKGGSGSGHSSSSSGGKSVHVSGYTRSDGTHVNGYDRSAPGSADGSGSDGGGSTSGSGSARTTARTKSGIYARTTARGYIEDDDGIRTDPNVLPRTTARGMNGDVSYGVLLAEADDPAAGSDDPLLRERAARQKAEAEAADLRAEIEERKLELQAEADAKLLAKKRAKQADGKFRMAKALWDQDKKDAARKWMNEVIDDYPETPGAAKAKKFLVK